MAAPTPGEPVLISLSTPARRSLLDGLIRAPGESPAGIPVLDADAPDAEIADFLAGIAHTDTGYIARTSHGDRALAVLAATAAALCGDDIRTALTTPDLPFLTGLKPPAVEAVRGILRAIETDAPDTVRAHLAVLEP
ncbi:hypothetical protein IU433_11710 [Nocardia puris]|uniref:Uncharacterized protein n=1 Tax=Nocardia puris TaxID=208602 RepID=A0A366DNS7_9NOCA|nr:hypothetical protein [Nocardia puris]MBF6214210.1 hypothetical protein [Nocardia puris]MBF6365300.1 hypothetical protein [Nocardia puris]MBF6459702.1 hypothetical protein [Nocardia puris]RBO91753.1 hypothetical protein DFR74_104461 [Nocardia puris]